MGRTALFLPLAWLGLALPAQAQSAAAGLPLRMEAADTVPTSAGVLIGVLVVVLIFSVAFAWLRQQPAARGGVADVVDRLFGRRQANKEIRVLDSARLDPRVSLHCVQWNGRRLLLASGERGVAVLAEHDAVGESEGV